MSSNEIDASTVAADTAQNEAGPVLRLFLLAVRLGLAAVFLWSAAPKIAAPDLFAWNVHNYQILPPWGVNTMAITLPWLELVVGIFLLVGWWTRASATIVALLMSMFMAGFVMATARGLNVSCGCFEVGQGHAATPLWQVLLRDAAFLMAALLLMRFPWAPSLMSLRRLPQQESARRP